MGTITIKNLIGGSINIITNGGGSSEPAGHEKTWIWFEDQENYEEFDWSEEITEQTMVDAGLFNKNSLSWPRNPVKVEIGTNVTNIGEKAFAECGTLTTITIPNTVTNIGMAAFAGCGLTTITIPNTVTNIGMAAFGSCHDLTSVTIPDSVTSIGEWVFMECYSLTTASILGFTQAEIRANADENWSLINVGMTITAKDGTFTL